MSDARAGTVNTAGVTDAAAFLALMDGRPEHVQAIATAVRNLFYEALPETVEVVWLTQGTVGWGIGFKKFTEQFSYLIPLKGHVTLGFYCGGDLPDPQGLLPTGGGRQGGGRLSMRSVKLGTDAAVRDPALRALKEYAAAYVPPP